MQSQELGISPVEAALKFRGADFAAGQRHGFKDTLVAEFGFLIGLLLGSVVFYALVSIRVFSHKSLCAA